MKIISINKIPQPGQGSNLDQVAGTETDRAASTQGENG
jgi:hypothetical protein